jgi:putative phosphoesterase
MRIAALSDIHGNLPALEAVLAEVRREAFDLVVVCGDVASGPLPAESIDILRALPRARFVRGNADREVVAAYDSQAKSGPAGPDADWCAAQLSRDQRDFLDAFETTVVVEVDALGRVLFCHGSPLSDMEIMTARSSDEQLREMIGGLDADVVVCGHTHMQFDRKVDAVRVLNAGSVGMPYGEPGAYWVALGPDVDLRRTRYDLQAAAVRISGSTWPEAGTFARENVVSVPSAEEAFAFFERRSEP